MSGEILVIVEHLDKAIRASSFELCSFAEKLSSFVNAKCVGVVLGYPVYDIASEFADKSGFDVIAIENKYLSLYNAELYINSLEKLVLERKPIYVLALHSAFGWDFAPGLAVRVGGSCLTGIMDVSNCDGIRFIREILGGKVIKEVAPAEDRLSIITVLPGFFKPIKPSKKGSVELVIVELEPPKTKNLGYIETKRKTVDLSKADVIISAGRGIGAKENLKNIEELKECFESSAIGASRPVVDAGWLDYEHQVGLTGMTVSPKVYIACGISGALQHTVGMKGSQLIIAINKDPKALIFKIANIGIVKDLNKFLPVLIEKLRKLK